MSASPQPRLRDIAALIVALVWLLAFGGHFFSQRVASDLELERIDVLADSGWLLLDNVLPAPGEHSRNSGWQYFPQRFDLLFVAGTMLLAVWSAGQLALRLLKIEPPTPAERIVFAFGLGLSAWSLVTLGLGLAGMLSRPVFVVLMAAVTGGEWLVRRRQRQRDDRPRRTKRIAFTGRRFLEGPRLPLAISFLVAPFLLAMLLGAMLPTTDFDVKEYHLQGPKEWWQQGRITFLPHNVYTSFPFLTELLSLWGMVLRGDWYRGALIGQVVLMSFAPLSAVAIYAICRPVSTTAGWIGAGAFLTIPWIYRISVIAYAEGGWMFFLAATFLAWTQYRQTDNDESCQRRVLLCGLLAGSAMGCKYPGLVNVVVPIGLAVVWTALGRIPPPNRNPDAQALPGRSTAAGAGKGGMRSVIVVAAVFSLGAAITFGPWALKNLIETGNPVYPLAYTIFGGRDWTPELNEKWRNGHNGDLNWKDPAGIPADLRKHAADVAVNSVWQSPLVFGIAPLALLAVWPMRRREGEAPADPRGKLIVGQSLVRSEQSSSHAPSSDIRARILVMPLILYSAYLFLIWWGLTHRIDRFWVPMLPIICALAGIGGAGLVERIDHLFDAGRRSVALGSALTLACLVILATAYNLTMATSGQSGFNAYLLDANAARRMAMQQTPSIALLDARLPPGAKVLMVGEAAVFDAKFSLRYNTVFDFELLQAWATDEPLSLHKADIPLKSREEILAKLQSEGITHVFVNWLEILRYREPGSYTYTDFISPRTMQKLVDVGVLNPVRMAPQETAVEYGTLSPQKQQEIERWAPELRSLVTLDGEQFWLVRAFELYTVAEK